DAERARFARAAPRDEEDLVAPLEGSKYRGYVGRTAVRTGDANVRREVEDSHRGSDAAFVVLPCAGRRATTTNVARRPGAATASPRRSVTACAASARRVRARSTRGGRRRAPGLAVFRAPRARASRAVGWRAWSKPRTRANGRSSERTA